MIFAFILVLSTSSMISARAGAACSTTSDSNEAAHAAGKTSLDLVMGQGERRSFAPWWRGSGARGGTGAGMEPASYSARGPESTRSKAPGHVSGAPPQGGQ